jgi:putative FmdB family regulatory protein
MPIYEYECLECRQQFEHLLRSADSRVTCPHCGRENLQRLVSLSGFSSESSRAANLSAAHKRAAEKRQEKQRSDHAEHHDHFGDTK